MFTRTKKKGRKRKQIENREYMRRRREAESFSEQQLRLMKARIRRQRRIAVESSVDRLRRLRLDRERQRRRRTAGRLSSQMLARESHSENSLERLLKEMQDRENHQIRRKSECSHRLSRQAQDIETHQIRRISKNRSVRISREIQDKKCNQSRIEIERIQDRESREIQDNSQGNASRIRLRNLENDTFAYNLADSTSHSLGVIQFLSEKKGKGETSGFEADVVTKKNEQRNVAENSSPMQPTFMASISQTNDLQKDSGPVIIDVRSAKEDGQTIFMKDDNGRILTNFKETTNSSNNSNNFVTVVTENNNKLKNEQRNVAENSSPMQPNFMASISQTNDLQKDSEPVIIDVMSAKEGGQAIFMKDDNGRILTNFKETTNSSNNSNNFVTAVTEKNNNLKNEQRNVAENSSPKQPNFMASISQTNDLQKDSGPVIIDVMSAKEGGQAIFMKDDNGRILTNFNETTNSSNNSNNFVTAVTEKNNNLVISSKDEPRVLKTHEKSKPSVERSLENNLIIKDHSNLLFQDILEITGGEANVTSRNLLSIKIFFENSPKKMKTYREEITTLMYRLSAEGFIKSHVQWLVKKGFVKSTSACNVCGNKAHLNQNNNFSDGCSWLCQNNQCRCENIFKRPKFYARFPMLPISHMAALIFHWTIQSPLPKIIADAPMDISKLSKIWRSFQVLCSTSLREKNVKLGGESEIVELCMVQYGKAYILGAMERSTRNTVFRAFPTEEEEQHAPTVLKEIKQLILPHSFVVVNRTKSFKMLSGYYVMDADDTVMNPSDTKFHCLNVSRYLCCHIDKMFGHLKAEDVRIEVIQKYLDELMWRERFGKTPTEAFYNILGDISELETRGTCL